MHETQMREARQEYKRNLLEFRERYEERFIVTLESIRKHERKVQKCVPVYVIGCKKALFFLWLFGEKMRERA